MRRRVALLFTLVALGGCGAFRASVGVGFGIGASARVGLVDVGGLGGGSMVFGNCYGLVGSHVAVDIGLPPFGRIDAVSSLDENKDDTQLRFNGPIFLAAMPFLPNSPWYSDVVLARPTEIAASVYAGFFSLQLGFDPQGFVGEVAERWRIATGHEPRAWAREANVRPDPEDEQSDPPFHVIALEDVAAVDTDAPALSEHARRALVEAAREHDALVRVEDGAVERWVAPRAALARVAPSDEARARMAELARPDARAELSIALALRDPERLATAIERNPVSDVTPELERARGELLLEEGRADEAVLAFERAGDDESAKARLAAARAAVERAPPQPRGLAHEGSAELAGFRLGFADRAAWAVTPWGDVAWERSDSLPPGFCASRVVGAQSGLAIVEAMAKGRAWVLGIDENGATRWRTPLAIPQDGPAERAYALHGGRVFVIRTDSSLAIEAATGRVLWMRRRAPEERDAKKRERDTPRPFGEPSKPPVIPARGPDGAHGFEVSVDACVLEIRRPTSEPSERLDPESGATLDLQR